MERDGGRDFPTGGGWDATRSRDGERLSGPVEPGRPPLERGGRYILDPEPFAEGGMGKIWKAWDKVLLRHVAVKSLKPALSSSLAARGRFARETRIMALLPHPGVCPIYDKYLSMEPPCYTMKLVEGETLEKRIRDLHGRGGDVLEQALPSLVQVMISLCNTLSFAHHQGVIHRDLKPANILLGPFGEVYVMDWGLARVVGGEGSAFQDGTEEDGSVTENRFSISGTVMGTPGYMAPEQARGDLEEIDGITDVYGLGAVLFHCLAGVPPHKGKDKDSLLEEARRGRVPSPLEWKRGLPRDLAAICRKALAPAKEDRYASAAEMGKDLQRFLQGKTVSAYTYQWWEKAAKWGNRNRRALLAVGWTALAASILISVVLFFYSRDMGRAARRAVELREDALVRLAQSQFLLGRPLAARRTLEEAEKISPPGSAAAERVSYMEDRSYLRAWPPFAAFPGDGKAVTGLSFFGGGRFLAAGFHGGFYQVREALTGRVLSSGRLGDRGDVVVEAAGRGDLAAFVAVEDFLDRRRRTSSVFLVRPNRPRPVLLFREKGWIRGCRFFRGEKGPVLVCDAEIGPGRVLDLSSDPPRSFVPPAGKDGGGTALLPRGAPLFSWTGEEGDKVVRFREGRTGRLLYGKEFPYSVSIFSHDGAFRKLLLAHFRNWFLVDLAGGRALGDARETETRIEDALLTPDGKWAVIVERSGQVRIWNLESGGGPVLFGIDRGESGGAALDPSGGVLAVGNDRGDLFFFQLPRAGKEYRFRHEGTVRSLAFSPSGEFLLSAGEDRVLLFRDLLAGRILARHVLPWKGKLVSAALSPGGNRVLCGGDGGVLRLLDTVTGRQVLSLRGHRSRVWTVCFSRDGRLAASGSRDKTIRVWDLERGKCREVLEGHRSSVKGVRFGPGGKILASSSVDGTVRTWALPGGRPLGTWMVRDSDTVYQIFFDDRGGLLFSVHEGRFLRLDPASGEIREIGRCAEAALGLDCLPGGRLAFLAGMGGRVGIYEPLGKGLLWDDLVQGAVFYCAGIAPGGAWIAAGRRDGGIFLMPCRRAGKIRRLREEARTLRARLLHSPGDRSLLLRLARNYARGGGWDWAARAFLALLEEGALPPGDDPVRALWMGGFPAQGLDLLGRMEKSRGLSVYERLLRRALERDLSSRKEGRLPGGGPGSPVSPQGRAR